jgi:hypothetical protein
MGHPSHPEARTRCTPLLIIIFLALQQNFCSNSTTIPLYTSFSSALLNIFVLKFVLHVFANFQLPHTVVICFLRRWRQFHHLTAAIFRKSRASRPRGPLQRGSQSRAQTEQAGPTFAPSLTRRVLTPPPPLDDAKAGSNHHLKSKIPSPPHWNR